MWSLKITPAPFKSSYLSIPPSPFSPRLPLNPTYTNPKSQVTYISDSESTFSHCPPPLDPLQWLWQCHICRQTYALGVTRRCLDDGHYFCAGTTTVKTWRKAKNPRKVRRHRACASEFDYQGWKVWGDWRRDLTKYRRRTTCLLPDLSDSSESSSSSDSEEEVGRDRKDCWNMCDYPSECRWGKQFVTQAVKPSPVIPVHPPPPPLPPMPSVPTPPPATTFASILKPFTQSAEVKDVKAGKDEFWSNLDIAATRRSSVGSGLSSALTPLALNPVPEESEDGNEDWMGIDLKSTATTELALFSSSSNRPSSSAAPAFSPLTLKDLITTPSKKYLKAHKKTSKAPKPLDPVLQIPDPVMAMEVDLGFAERESTAGLSEITVQRGQTRDGKSNGNIELLREYVKRYDIDRNSKGERES